MKHIGKKTKKQTKKLTQKTKQKRDRKNHKTELPQRHREKKHKDKCREQAFPLTTTCDILSHTDKLNLYDVGRKFNMSEEIQVLKTVTQRLNESNLPYMITGSIAANYYTTPRMTRDIDIVLQLTAADVDRFVTLFEHDFYVDRNMVRNEVLREGMFNLISNEYVIKVDCIVRKTDPYQEVAFSRRQKVSIAGSPMFFISPEDLVVNKLSWANDSESEIQLRDVRSLLESVDDLDVAYVEKWIAKLNLGSLYSRVKS